MPSAIRRRTLLVPGIDAGATEVPELCPVTSGNLRPHCGTQCHPVATAPSHTAQALCVNASPDGCFIAMGRRDGTIAVFRSLGQYATNTSTLMTEVYSLQASRRPAVSFGNIEAAHAPSETCTQVWRPPGHPLAAGRGQIILVGNTPGAQGPYVWIGGDHANACERRLRLRCGTMHALYRNDNLSASGYTYLQVT